MHMEVWRGVKLVSLLCCGKRSAEAGAAAVEDACMVDEQGGGAGRAIQHAVLAGVVGGGPERGGRPEAGDGDVHVLGAAAAEEKKGGGWAGRRGAARSTAYGRAACATTDLVPHKQQSGKHTGKEQIQG
jgi:hypothetical protein